MDEIATTMNIDFPLYDMDFMGDILDLDDAPNSPVIYDWADNQAELDTQKEEVQSHTTYGPSIKAVTITAKIETLDRSPVKLNLLSLAKHAPHYFIVDQHACPKSFSNGLKFHIQCDSIEGVRKVSGLLFKNGTVKLTALRGGDSEKLMLNQVVAGVKAAAKAAAAAGQEPCVEGKGVLTISTDARKYGQILAGASVGFYICYPLLVSHLEKSQWAHDLEMPKKRCLGASMQYAVSGCGKVGVRVFWTGEIQLRGAENCPPDVVDQCCQQVVQELLSLRTSIELIVHQNPWTGDMGFDGGRRLSKEWRKRPRQDTVEGSATYDDDDDVENLAIGRGLSSPGRSRRRLGDMQYFFE